MAGVPSIVYGFFGLVVIVPMVRENIGGNGSSMLTASILLAIMILPTIIEVTESSLRSVPDSYYEGSLALGATHERSVFFAVLPAAKSGLLAGVVLGIGRAIGETMAVIMVAGNQARMPAGLLKGVRTMTSNIVLGNGICIRSSQRSIDCNSSSFVCIYLNYQSGCIPAESEDTKCKLIKEAGDRELKEYKKSPMSALLAILVYLAGIITFAVLIYLVVYILVRGIPNLTLDLFSWTYTSDNVSMLPSHNQYLNYDSNFTVDISAAWSIRCNLSG